jgi:23S rRNA (adenine2030-N6)-methyltransferase
MNYRHIYHAGNFADVFKHIVLALLLDHLRQKDKPFFVLDTHAGIGLYDLESGEALKTGEAAGGIGKLWAHRTDAPPEVKLYLDIVRRVNGQGGEKLKFYPGSPILAREMLRDDDRLAAGELHPDDFKILRKAVGHDRRVSVEAADGYTLIKAQLPPDERRGLVLVDPPFEVTNEFDLMLKGLKEGYKRWATGIYTLWYPVKDLKPVEKFHRDLADAGIPKIMAAHFMIRPPADPDKFNGCGMIIVNPPWTLRGHLDRIGPWLAGVLADRGRARYEVIEITGEAP